MLIDNEFEQMLAKLRCYIPLFVANPLGKKAADMAFAKMRYLFSEGETFAEAFENKLKTSEVDKKSIVLLAHYCWEFLPDDPNIHRIPGFCALCDVAQYLFVNKVKKI